MTRRRKPLPEFASYPAGTPAWVDIQSADIEATIAFYGGLFGWATDDLGPDAGGYRAFTKNGKWVAGVGPQMVAGAPVAWMTYVNVDDIAIATEATRTAGGNVFLEPMRVLDAGQLAVVSDPVGGVFALWEPGTHTGAQVANEANAFVWSELQTRDTDAAVTFYATVFGWRANTEDLAGMPYTQWMLGERSIGGMTPMPDMIPAEVGAYWLTYFGVSDADAAISTATSLGGTVIVPATDTPVGRLAVLTDPAGAAFAIIAMPEQE
jgi:hypothetical protein